MARPTKYNVDRSVRVLDSIKAGMTYKAACGYAGIDYKTFLNWQQRYSSFSAQVATAEQEAESRYTGVIAKAAFGHDVVKTTTTMKADGTVEQRTETSHEYDWHAALEWLKRRRRRDWGDSVHVNVDEEIARLLAELAGEGHTPPA